MLKQRNQAVSNSISGSYQDIADRIAAGSRNAIWQLRQLSRASGFKSVIDELDEIGIDFDPDQSVLSNLSIADWVESRAIANRFAQAWLAIAVREGSVRDANRLSLSRMQTIATTESSKAFNEGKTVAADQVDPEYSGMLIKIWDSTLDSNTCPVCASSDGDMVYIHERFDNGEPGAVHPRCRCSYHIVTEAEVVSSDKAA